MGTFVKSFGTLTLCSLRVFNFILTRKYFWLQSFTYFISERSTGSNFSAFYFLFYIFCISQKIVIKRLITLHVNISQLRAYIKPQINEKPMDPDSKKSIHTKYGFLKLHKVVYNRSKDQFCCLKTEWYSSQFFFFKLSEEDGGHKMLYKLKLFKGTGLKSFAPPSFPLSKWKRK